MAQPLLDFGDIGVVFQGIGRRRGPQGVNAEAVNIGVDAHLLAIPPNHFLVDRSRVERLVEGSGRVVLHRTKEGTGQVGPMAGDFQVFLDQPRGFRGHRHEADLVALAGNAQMEDA